MAAAEQLVRDRCVGDYEALAKYIPPHVTFQDLFEIAGTEEDFEDVVEKVDRLGARLFFRRVLHPVFATLRVQKEDAAQGNPFGTGADFTPSSYVERDGTLALSSRLFPSSLKSLMPSPHGREGGDGDLPPLCTDDLLEYFKLPLQGVVRATFTNNHLFDNDLALIADFVPQRLPNCRLVDLSYNRFARCDEALRALLAIKTLAFVCICHNPIATVDRKDFFAKLSEEELSKLVFVPREWVGDTGWHKLFAPAAQQQVPTEAAAAAAATMTSSSGVGLEASGGRVKIVQKAHERFLMERGLPGM